VAPPIPPPPLPVSSRSGATADFQFDDEVSPRSRRQQTAREHYHTHRTRGNLSAGALRGFGAGIGCVFGVIVAIGLLSWFIYYSITESRKANKAQESKERESAPIIQAPGEGIVIEDVVISIESVSVGKVSYVDSLFNNQSESEKTRMVVRLRIMNKSATRKIDYRSFQTDRIFSDNDPRLEDEHGNNYSKINSPFSSKIADSSGSCAIMPGKAIQDAIVFEEPVDVAKDFTLRLPAKSALGMSKDVTLRFTDGLFRIKQPNKAKKP
jgi:hypothetical protein